MLVVAGQHPLACSAAVSWNGRQVRLDPVEVVSASETGSSGPHQHLDVLPA